MQKLYYLQERNRSILAAFERLKQVTLRKGDGIILMRKEKITTRILKETVKSHSQHNIFNGFLLTNAVSVRQRFGFPLELKDYGFFRHSDFL